MGEIVNLRHIKKQKLRQEMGALASQNRAKFGRTVREKKIAEVHTAEISKKLDGHFIGTTAPKV